MATTTNSKNKRGIKKVKVNKAKPEIGKVLSGYSLIKDRKTLVSSAVKGVPTTIFKDLVQISGQSQDTVAKWFEANQKTLKAKKILNPTHGEKSLKYINLFKIGIEVFGEIEALKKWLQKPSFGLGGEIPLNLMSTFTGIDLITEEITRIAYGDLS